MGANTASAAAASSCVGSAAISSSTTAPVPARPCSTPIAERLLRSAHVAVVVATAAAAQVAPPLVAVVRGRRRGACSWWWTCSCAAARKSPLNHLTITRAASSRITMPTAFSAPVSSHAGSSDLKKIRGRPITQQHRGVSGAPPHAEPGGGAPVAAVGRDQRGDRDEVVRVGCVAQPEHQRDPERDQQRSAAEQARQPGVDFLYRMKQKLEVHPDPLHISIVMPHHARPWQPLTSGHRWWITPSRPDRTPQTTSGTAFAVRTMPSARITQGRQRGQHGDHPRRDPQPRAGRRRGALALHDQQSEDRDRGRQAEAEGGDQDQPEADLAAARSRPAARPARWGTG